VVLFRKGVFKKTASIHASILTETENKIFIFSKIIMLSVFIYSIFLPLQLGMIWFSRRTIDIKKTKGGMIKCRG